MIGWIACWILLAVSAIAEGLTRTKKSGMSDSLSLATDYLCALATGVALCWGFVWALTVSASASTMTDLFVIVGVTVAAMGIALRHWSIRTLSGLFFLTPSIERDHVVVASGPYSLVRHPGYLALLMLIGGTLLTLGSIVGLAGLAVLVPSIWLRSEIEEAQLIDALGWQYELYRASTPYRLIPGIC